MGDMQAITREPVKAPLVTEPLGFFGSLQAARSNLLGILPQISVTQPMVSGKTGLRWHMVMDPPSIRRMLLEKVDAYPKSVVTKNLLRPAIGESMFVAEGAHWRWQRRAAAPAFSHRNIKNLAPIMTRSAEAAADRIGAGRGKRVAGQAGGVRARAAALAARRLRRRKPRLHEQPAQPGRLDEQPTRAVG